MLYDDIYHTVVIAPATSNTVAKCVVGISDTLPTNMFAQAGKLGIPGIVFACDTEPVVVTRSPHDWVTLCPRRHRARQRRATARHRGLPGGVLAGRARGGAASAADATSTGMEHIVFLTGRLAQPQLESVLAGIEAAPFTWEVRDDRPAGRGADDGRADHAPRAGAADDRAPGCTRAARRPHAVAGPLPRRHRGVERALRRSGTARARGVEGPAAFLQPGCQAGGLERLRHRDLCRDRRCAAARRGRGRRTCARVAARWRRRDRPRLPAGDAVCAPRGLRPGAQRRGPSRSASTRSIRKSCCAAAAPAPTTCSA